MIFPHMFQKEIRFGIKLLYFFVLSGILFFHQIPGAYAGASCPEEIRSKNGIVDTNVTLEAVGAASDGVYNCSDLNIVVKSGSTLTLVSRDTGDENYDDDYGVTLTAANITVEAGGAIRADGMGYSRGRGPGTAGACSIGLPICGGGGFGGKGGKGAKDSQENSGGISYGLSMPEASDYKAPIGSGAAKSTDDPFEGVAGGKGGGSIKLVTTGNCVINGEISANGENGNNSTSYDRGGGAGGSIFIITSGLSGAGILRAHGGNGTGNASSYGGGGAGGRIFVQYTSEDPINNLFDSEAQAGASGNGVKEAEYGTVGFWQKTNNELIAVNAWEWNTTESKIFEYVTLMNARARMKGLGIIQGNEAVTINNSTLTIEGGGEGERVIRAGGQITMANSSIIEGSGSGIRLVMEASVFDLQNGSKIQLNDVGYESAKGSGAGVSGSGSGSGAGYGGTGGSGAENVGGLSYGQQDPKIIQFEPGSGGGGIENGKEGAQGGGMLRLDIQDVLILDGAISTNGGDASENVGAGSGGSVYVITAIMRGAGTILSNGGNAQGSGGAGGGGRIALCYDVNESNIDLVNNVTVHGGNGSSAERNGSDNPSGVFFCQANRFQDIRNILTWAWVGSYLSGEGFTGWMSTSCNNPTQSCENNNYGVTANFTSGDIDGWSWLGDAAADNPADAKSIGWVNFDPNPYPGPPNHGVKVNMENGDISGWAKFYVKESEKELLGNDWGWIKFGDDTGDDRENYWSKMNLNTGEISGWAWAGGDYSADNGGELSGFGLLSLNCTNRGTCSDQQLGGIDYGLTVNLETGKVDGMGWFGGFENAAVGFAKFDCNDWDNPPLSCNGDEDPSVRVNVDTDGTFSGYAWVGITDAEGDLARSPGFIDFNPDAFPAEPHVAARFDPATSIVYGWALIESIHKEGQDLGYNDWGWIKLGELDLSESKRYGLTISKENRTLDGYAWSSGGTAPGYPLGTKDVGLGIIHFNAQPVVVESYLQTKYGDVYSGGNITGKAAPQANATYLILANGDIVNFSSENINNYTNFDNLEMDNTGIVVDVPDMENRYSNALGRLDLEKITYVSEDGVNDYGDEVETIGDTLHGSLSLGGKVWMSEGDLTIDSDVEFLNGANVTGETVYSDASGLIVVPGNLYINSNARYENASDIEHILNLASVAWVVEGDIIVNSGVQNIVGAFIDLGEKIYIEDSDAQLTVRGLLMAKQFYFGRTYEGDSGNIGELIMYDGRLLANTPPGLRDFSQALPKIERITP